jgi:hypothetical protein
MQHHLTRCTSLILASLALLTIAAQAQVPPMVSYQGRVLMNNTNFGGTGQFKFALVRGAGPTLLWKNDGSAGNTEPAAAVSLPVANGLVMTTLGDTALANMTAIPATVFEQPDVRLRVWFNGGAGFQQLTPDQRIVSVGYAMMAGNVTDGAITAAKLAPGVLSPANFPANSVTSVQLGDDLDLGSTTTLGRLDIYRTAANTPAITLDGASSTISTFGTDGLEQIRLHGTSWGELWLNNSLENNARAVTLSANSASGGFLRLNNSNGLARANISGANTGGALTLYQADGGVGVFADGENNGAGLLDIRSTNGTTLIRLNGEGGGRIDSASTVNLMNSIGGNIWAQIQKNGSGGGAFRTLDEAGNTTTFLASQATGVGGFLHVHMGNSIWPGVVVDGDDGNSGQILVKRNANDQNGVEIDGFNGLSSEISLFHTNNVETVEIIASEGGTAGAQILMRNAAGVNTIQLDSDASGVACGYLALYRSNGVANIILNAEDGTLRGQVVEITGGSDFSEKFEIGGDAFEPGMIVSIDPKNPGQLALTTAAHDKKVAGIVSGAGGVKPGMLMGQRGSVADGKHPVALTGRVYCWVDADANGSIEPGDMLTTSGTPGHGMKVTDHTRAVGAIVGKAMTSLAKGKGLVLVLVNLQ